jgi:hypothetical protein
MVVTELALSPARLGGLQIRHLLTLAITCLQRDGASGNSLGLGKMKGAGQVHGRVSKASTQRTSPEEHPAAQST